MTFQPIPQPTPTTANFQEKFHLSQDVELSEISGRKATVGHMPPKLPLVTLVEHEVSVTSVIYLVALWISSQRRFASCNTEDYHG